MEFNSKEFPDLKLFYRFRKLTKNQLEFTSNLLHNIINNNCVIYEFPPTLDKDFLYNSVLFTLAGQKEEKFVILTKNYDKIYELLKNFTSISNISKKITKHSSEVKVVPFFDRKMMCINELALEEASSLDFDSYCNRVTSSWVSEENKCPYFTNYASTKAKIQYQNSNFEDNIYDSDFQNTFSNLSEKRVCPFYYYLNLMQNSNPNIIICTYKDYFDMKARIQINKLLAMKDDLEYKLILDDCSDMENMLQNLYSMNIDENLLFNASNQLFFLKEKYSQDVSEYKDSFRLLEGTGINKNDKNDENVEMVNINEIKNEIKNETEKELILFNGFPLTDKFPGNIRKSNHFLNLLSRLLIFIKRAFFGSKNENLWSIYKLQQQLLAELWIDLKSLNSIFKRFILFLNEIKYNDHQNIYHLINFLFFINYVSLYNEGFLLNYQKYTNSDNFYLELYLIETHRILDKFLNSANKANNANVPKQPIFISGGIGKIEIFAKLLKLPNSESVLKKDFVDDSIRSNIYLTNISNTNVNNNSFYGEIIMKLCKAVPDGIICYFSSLVLMEYYIQKWNEQGVFDYIMDDKLLFIEEQDSARLASIVTNFKKSCNIGRGGIFFMSTRNKASLFDDTFTDIHSRCVIFIGFPIETKLTKIFELRLEHYKKLFGIESKEFLNFDTFKLFTNKISQKIADINDKKVLVILDERLISDKLKDYLPSWLHKLIHIDFDKENVNTDERLKNIKEFLIN